MISRAIFFQTDAKFDDLVKLVSEFIDAERIEERYSDNVASGGYFKFSKKGVEYCLEICDFEENFNFMITIDSDYANGCKIEDAVIIREQENLFNKIKNNITQLVAKDL